MKLMRSYRRCLRRACLLLFACTLMVLVIPIGIKMKTVEYFLGEDWVKCQIPALQIDRKSLPFRPSNFHPKNCAQGFPRVVRRQDNFVEKVYDVQRDMQKVRCFYAPLLRKHPNETQPPYTEKFRLGTVTEFHNRKQMVDEFVYVNCTYMGVTIFEDYFSFFPKKRHSLRVTSKNEFNVLVVGLKGMSRANLYRTMPKTVGYLKRELDAIDFLKYHKVSEDTFENMAAMLMGLNAGEFKRVSRKRKVFVPLITYKYMNAGFMTAFAEDCAVKGVFKDDYVFKTRPAHYYWAPCNVALDALGGNARKGNCSVCLKDKMSYEVLLDYARNFARAMHVNSRVYFGLFWTNSLTSSERPSDGLYLPRLADEGYEKFFEELHQEGLLRNTIVIFLSESGYASRQLASFDEYKQEERLPFLFVVLPKILRLRNPGFISNIRSNAEKHLVTPFDVYATLLCLLDFNQMVRKSEMQARGYNLFAELPPFRNCKWAGIDSKLCSCVKSFGSFVLNLF